MPQSKDMIEQLKSVITIAIPIIACLFFFFATKTGVDINATRIAENKASIEKMEIKMENMNAMLQENNTNIKLLQKDVQYLIESMKDK
jgi:hypothetical protein|tara:strand:- start:500 stop:763 length:264 start_codon:yes stop_codon:yes gene_type:complete